MATWSLLQNLTNFDFRSVCSDGADIYFVQYGGDTDYHVHKYDVSLDTVTQISNSSSWTGTNPKLMASVPGGLGGAAIQWFKGNLYAAVFTTDGSNNFRVFRYSGSGTSWTQVLAITNPGGDAALFSDGNYLIFAPTTDIGLLFDWGQYSADGSSWSAASVSNSPPPITTGAGLTWSRSGATYGQKISPVFTDISSHSTFEPDPDSVIRWFQWSAGTFSITHTTTFTGGAWTPSDTWLREGAYIRDFLHWSTETNSGTVWKYAVSLGDAWTTPTGHFQNGFEIYPVFTVGPLNKQAGDCGGDFALLTSGAWETPETVGSAGLSHLVVLDGGEGFLFGASGVQAAIWGRSETFPLPGPGVAKFYQGEGTLAEKFDLPFNVVHRGGMAVRENGGVAIGSGVAAAPNVIVTGPANYSSYEDRTEDHPAEVIRRLVWIEGL